MCLGVPMKITSIQGREGRAELDGVVRRVGLDLVPGAAVGDFVIVHAGYAIQVLDEESALETLKLLSEIGPFETGP
jgi:hydrogenase expression/formation protein HypC